MTRIAIFASGSGSNAENIIRYFSDNKSVKVVLVLSNQSRSGVLIRAQLHNIPTFIFTKNDLNECSKVHDMLKDYNASMIVLAGFLLKIPLYMIEAYPNSILNIHPCADSPLVTCCALFPTEFSPLKFFFIEKKLAYMSLIL